MTIVQPCWLRVVVTVRPASSVREETALAIDRPRPEDEDELEDDEETETEERDDPREEALAWATPFPRLVFTVAPPGSGTQEWISRPSARIRIMEQVPLALFEAPAATAAAAPIMTMCRNAIAALL